MKKNRKLSFIAIPAILLTAAVAVSAMVALKNEYGNNNCVGSAYLFGIAIPKVVTQVKQGSPRPYKDESICIRDEES